MGAGNFAVAYTRDRKGFEEPVDPHSLPVRIISQTGIVGAALFLGFLVAAMAALWRVRRPPDVLRRAVAAAAFVGFAYWFVHGSADWLFAIPAVAGPAFAWLGMAVALGSAPASRVEGRARGRGGEPVAAPPASAIAQLGPRGCPPSGRDRPAVRLHVAMLAAIVPPWLAANAVDEAAATWRKDPPAAFHLLSRALA